MTFALLLQAKNQQPWWGTPLMLIAMAVIFYFLLIRPQSQARKKAADRLSKLKVGDEVVLSSGFYVVVDRVESDFIYAKLGTAVVKVRKAAVVALSGEPVPEQKS